MNQRLLLRAHNRLLTRFVVLLGALTFCSLSQARTPPSAKDGALEASLREAVHSIPVADTEQSIVVTSFRPRGDGPFPWIVLSHGTAVTREANLAIGRNRNLPVTSEWVRRGYAVLVPIRRGYGASVADTFGDKRGSCEAPAYRAAGEGAALDLLATVKWAKTHRDLDPKRWLLAGQSAGGFASIYTASKRPSGLLAVLAFSPGRGGDADARPVNPARRISLPNCSPLLRQNSTYPCFGFTPRTMNSSARACSASGLRASAKPVVRANYSSRRRSRNDAATAFFHHLKAFQSGRRPWRDFSAHTTLRYRSRCPGRQ